MTFSPSQAAQTAATIAAAQEPSGRIPWFPGGKMDPWDHVEAAMALDLAGRPDAARAAYQWLRDTQRADGSWPREWEGDAVADAAGESNHAAYPAVGLLTHLLLTGDQSFVDSMWPMVTRGLEFVLALQRPTGEVAFIPGSDTMLLTGCSSIYHGLRAALALARHRGEAQPDWELAATTLGHTIVAHPERFSPKERWSMDWYYPVLGGALRGPAALDRIDKDWGRFVVPGLGIRCVDDRPWVTGAETAELVLALCAVDRREQAAQLFADIQHARLDDGSYWTGFVFPDNAFWPRERTTWTAAAMLLADAMLRGEPVITEVFGGATLPVGPDELAPCDQCVDTSASL